MKVVILAGGKGTRISEESKTRPKPMVEIGGKPILWHIMQLYAGYGFCDFIVCCGYKGYMIKEYFVNYYMHNNNVQYNIGNYTKKIYEHHMENWKVTLVDTGLETLTAGRILQIREYLNDEPFMLTYGDGVSDINLLELKRFHENHKKVMTISITQPEGRFGTIKMDWHSDTVLGFREKAREEQSWVNIGFMMMQPEVFQYLGNGSTMLETVPFEKMVKDGQMTAYRHKGFWAPMDNVHDRDYLEKLWKSEKAPWSKRCINNNFG